MKLTTRVDLDSRHRRLTRNRRWEREASCCYQSLILERSNETNKWFLFFLMEDRSIIWTSRCICSRWTPIISLGHFWWRFVTRRKSDDASDIDYDRSFLLISFSLFINTHTRSLSSEVHLSSHERPKSAEISSDAYNSNWTKNWFLEQYVHVLRERRKYGERERSDCLIITTPTKNALDPRQE